MARTGQSRRAARRGARRPGQAQAGPWRWAGRQAPVARTVRRAAAEPGSPGPPERREPMIYLDSCALVKLIREESESLALQAWLDERADEVMITSELARAEVLRAVR